MALVEELPRHLRSASGRLTSCGFLCYNVISRSVVDAAIGVWNELP